MRAYIHTARRCALKRPAIPRTHLGPKNMQLKLPIHKTLRNRAAQSSLHASIIDVGVGVIAVAGSAAVGSEGTTGTPNVGGGQHAVKPGGVTSARRDQGREPTAPGGALGDPRGAAGGIGSSEVVLDAAIGTRGQAVGRDQGPEQVADEPLERGSVGGIDGGVWHGGRSHR